MPALDTFAQKALESLEKQQLLRATTQCEKKGGAHIRCADKEYLSFSCNDYFGMAQHPEVIQASLDATRQYGAGAGASRLVTGSHPYYQRLESALAQYKKTEAACVIGSGYLANIGVIPALVGKGDLIVADKWVHACILDGIKLSGATLKRFSHNSLNNLNNILSKNRNLYNKCLIISESVFSMDGDLAPIDGLVKIKNNYDAWLMIDDAHGIGIVPPNPAIDIQMGTLSKGIGAYGGYVCGARTTIEYMKNHARSLIFSTALPPGVVAAAEKSLKILSHEKSGIKKALHNAARFCQLLGLPETGSTIVPLILGEEEKALSASRKLREAGYLAHPIRPPAVPRGTARLRFAFSSMHTGQDIESLAKTIKKQEWFQCR